MYVYTKQICLLDEYMYIYYFLLCICSSLLVLHEQVLCDFEGQRRLVSFIAPLTHKHCTKHNIIQVDGISTVLLCQWSNKKTRVFFALRNHTKPTKRYATYPLLKLYIDLADWACIPCLYMTSNTFKSNCLSRATVCKPSGLGRA